MLLGGVTCFSDMYFYTAGYGGRRNHGGHAGGDGLIVIEFPSPYASDAKTISARVWRYAIGCAASRYSASAWRLTRHIRSATKRCAG